MAKIKKQFTKHFLSTALSARYCLFKKSAGFFLTLILFFTPFSSSLVFASGITETNIFNLTNNERANNNVATLSWNYKLASAARAKAQDMIDKDYFSHNTPDGKTPWTFIVAEGYNYIYAGENLAMNFTSAEDLMAAWMASGGHRANILSGNFKELGVGVVTGEYQGYTTTMVVQMFGTQATAVYGNTEKKTSPKPSASSPAPAISNSQSNNQSDNQTLTALSSAMIKRRIEDFKKYCDYLIETVKERG